MAFKGLEGDMETPQILTAEVDVISNAMMVGPEDVTYAPQAEYKVKIYNFTDAYLSVSYRTGHTSVIPPIEFRPTSQELKVDPRKLSQYQNKFVFVQEITFPDKALSRKDEKVKMDEFVFIDKDATDLPLQLRNIIRETDPIAVGRRFHKSDVSYQIHYCFSREKCREARHPIYINEVDLMISTKETPEELRRIGHPFSSLNSNNFFREEYYKETETKFSGIDISFVDNEGKYGDFFINLAGEVVRLSPYKNCNLQSGIYLYFPKTIPNGKGGLIQDPEVKVKFYTVEELLEGEGKDGKKIWRKAEEALNLGTVEEIQRRIDKAVEIQVSQEQNRFKLEKLEWEKNLTESERRLKEAEKELEKLKAELAEKAERRKDHYDEKSRERKDHYEERSSSRSDTSDAWSTAFKVVGCVAAGCFALIKIFS